MKHLIRFIKSTITGGLLLLIPLLVLAVALMKGFELIHKISEPIAHRLPIPPVGIGKTTLVSILLLLLLCFIAGIFMQTTLARRLKQVLEEQVLVYIPGYSYLQALSTDKLTEGHQSTWKAASIILDNNEVICFVTAENEQYCTLFLPSAPTPSSGTVCVRRKELVKYLPISVSEAITIIKRFGVGAASLAAQNRPTD